MSRKTRRNAPANQAGNAEARAVPSPENRRRITFLAIAVALLAAFIAAAFVYRGQAQRAARELAERNAPLLASAHSPSLGKPDAKVHLVEFLDPACETCAAFYPEVKKLMAENPDRIRLSVRHVPFHANSEVAVRILEASRAQDRYWPTLERVVATQKQWTISHRVHPERLWAALEGSGLDLERLRIDMEDPAVWKRIERDLADARELGVTKTPEFFANGKPTPRFGLEELQALVRGEVREAYGTP